MNFTEHIIDRDVISQFISTVIPRTETCYEWYMDFDLIEKSNDKKKMVWEFTIDYMRQEHIVVKMMACFDLLSGRILL